MIPRTVLIASLPFTQALDGEAVARAIARGLTAAGLPSPDLCPIDPPGTRTPAPPSSPGSDASPGRADTVNVASVLDGLDFDARMRSSRAVILAQRSLEERTLRGSVAFEVATRARQGGVPAYAVAGESKLTAFDARIMDLQEILEASSARALVMAGRKLAGIV